MTTLTRERYYTCLSDRTLQKQRCKSKGFGKTTVVNVQSQSSSLELARFTTELLELRIKAFSGRAVSYAHSGAVTFGRKEFRTGVQRSVLQSG